MDPSVSKLKGYTLKEMVLQGYLSEGNGSTYNHEFCTEPNGSLHSETALQTDGECVVYGSTQNLFEKVSVYH